MDTNSEIACIEFTEEAKLAVGASLQDIANRKNSKSENVHPQRETVNASRSQRFTTITDFTEDQLIVNEIDEQLVKNYTELRVSCISNSVLPLPKKQTSSNKSIKKVFYDTNSEDCSNSSVSTTTAVTPTTTKKTSTSKIRKTLNCKKVSIRQRVSLNIRSVCPECLVEFDNFNSWKSHINNAHGIKQIPIGNSTNKNKDYFCDKCFGIIRVDTSLKMLYHQISHCPKPICFECRLCNWRHSCHTRLIRHIQTHHVN